ncbi:MMPL family transporter [Paenibacillus sp. TRM 82003]|uniref:MMPL family transporter n=1 Tax=Kineococcus sp. TRM81007 TaxID=2925831 RepID=UPI001F5A0880|nr:MMPL family transporter [Kineococcus sp. TRM81007]MCI2238324.1 MMPL family transporter [Kineococcus sp. TRM81007]MCI3924004.1 MMPL family transporter [Paenibacillus sp. TRM 82003]
MNAPPAVRPAEPGSPDEPPRTRGPGGDRGSAVAHWSLRHRGLVVVAWLLLLLAGLAAVAGGTTTSDEEGVGDSQRAASALEAAGFSEPLTETVVVSLAGGGAPLPVGAEAVAAEAVAAAHRGDELVREVGEPALSADGRVVAVPLVLSVDPGTGFDEAVERVPAVLERTAAVEATLRERLGRPDVVVGQVGSASVNEEVVGRLERDLRRAELVSLPITLVVLLLAFGSVVSALVPLLLGVVAVVVALGASALVSRVHPVAAEATSLTVLIGLAVGVDYALFVLHRARAARRSGLPVREAVLLATRTAGHAVVVSGATVVVSMLGMLVAGGLFTSLALGAAFVVAVAVLASATLLPVLLDVLGGRVDALRLPWRRGAGGDRPSAVGRAAAAASNRPVASLAVGVVLLGALAVPLTGLRTGLPGDDSLPRDLPTVQALHRLADAFPSQGPTADVVVTAPASSARDASEALADLAGEGGQPVRSSADGRTHVVTVPLATSADSGPEADEAVDALRASAVPPLEAAVPGAEVSVGGGVAEGSDVARWMVDRLPWVVGFVLVLTFAVVAVAFRSPLLALVTVLLNTLSCAAALGVVAAVFQGTWAEGLLAFTSIDAVVAWLPVLMFVVLFGLSMDYHVLVVSSVREEFAAGRPPAEAVRAGVARSAGVVTSAAAVMVAVFALFGTLSELGLKQLGVGLAVAVLLDATVVRGLVLPAALRLMGRRGGGGRPGRQVVPAQGGAAGAVRGEAVEA